MNIVLINPSLICGGSERVITLLANQMQKSHSVCLITTDREETPYFPLSSNVQRIGILKGMSNSRILSPFRKIKALWRIRREVAKRKPDLLITFQEKSSLYVLLALIGKKINKVVGVRNHPEYKKLSFFFSILRKLLFPSASLIVLQTEGIKHWYEDNGFNKKKLKVIINPLNIQKTSKMDLKPKTIMACGRLEPQKGFYELISLFSEISPEYPEWKLIIMGDGSEKGRLSKLINDKDLQDSVSLTGFQKNPTSFYHHGEIFAFSSHYEGFPNALCEAMASGMAVVSFDCPSGPSDLIEDGINGFLVESGDLQNFKERLIQLINDDDLRHKMGSQASKIAERLSIEEIAEEWLDVCEQKEDSV